ncbi:hypothetical protein [Streptomyces sp. NBC_00996]|uniref:hypothetical protein n=1 Tax=Streptomyces sp. NBC_00996 TaxID=2903710 RepID=UPI00386D4ABF|nr:hypothetical protein OG390_12245 [Streptomyces sp. NBC_00996]
MRRTLLRDRAYEAIRDAIVAGDIAPGAVVRDAELAELLGLVPRRVRTDGGHVGVTRRRVPGLSRVGQRRVPRRGNGAGCRRT